MEPDVRSIDYINEFNQYCQEYCKANSEMELDLLNQSLSLLGSTKNLRQFDPDLSDTAKFYINLYNLLANTESRSIIVASALQVLQQVCRNNQARLSLVEKFKYIPVLTKILSAEQKTDRQTRLLKVLQDITYGIRIKWQEPHLSDLIKLLIKFIENGDDSIQKLSLSVLINLCYKNLPSLYLLSRTINVVEFGNRIRAHGILACKMFLILENCFVDTDNENLHQFVKFTFVEIVHATRTYDTTLLRHIVDFFIDTKHNENTKSVINAYKNYLPDVKSMLEQLNTFKIKSPDTPNYHEQNISMAGCFSIIFELLVEILDFKIQTVYADLIEVILNWINMDESCNKGLELLRKIIGRLDSLSNENNDIVDRISRLLPEVLFITFRLEIPVEPTSSLLQLLYDMIKKSNDIQIRVYDIITEDFFENLFEKIFSNFYLMEGNQIAMNEVEMYMHGIHLLHESTKYLPNKFNRYIVKLFETKTMQIIFAKCFLSDNSRLSWIVLELAKNLSFPSYCVAELVAKQKPIGDETKDLKRVSSDVSLDDSMNYMNFSINQNIETKLNDTIDKVIQLRDHQNPSSISEIIEMFEYKIMISQNSEKDLLTRLEQSNNELITISQRSALLSAEISKFQNRNFSLHMTNEKLKENVINLQKQVKQLKVENDQLKVKLLNEAKNYRLLNETKTKLTQDLCELQKKLRGQENENEMNALKIGELKKVNKRYKMDLDQLNLEVERVIELKTKLNEYETKLLENSKEINSLLNVKLNLEKNCKQFEIDLAEKNDTISSYEMKLQEIDNMKNTVVQLMQSNFNKK